VRCGDGDDDARLADVGTSDSMADRDLSDIASHLAIQGSRVRSGVGEAADAGGLALAERSDPDNLLWNGRLVAGR
jgi:hypothetical protein